MQFSAYGGSYIDVSFQSIHFTAATQHNNYLTAFYS
jgi:hypothetical protein